MFVKEKILIGLGFTVSAAGVMAGTAAVHDMPLDSRTGIHVETIAPGGVERPVPFIGALVVPESALPALGELAIGVSLITMGALTSLRSNRAIKYQEFNNEWSVWQNHWHEDVQENGN